MKFQKVSRDANHIEIVKDLKKLGYKVIDLAAVGNGVPDIVVSDRNVTALVEIKMPKSQIYIAQLEFLAGWPGIAGFAQVTADVLDLMNEPERYRLSDSDQIAILNICMGYRKTTTDLRPRIRVMEFEKQFELRKKVPF